jgi:hypothetical protein
LRRTIDEGKLWDTVALKLVFNLRVFGEEYRKFSVFLYKDLREKFGFDAINLGSSPVLRPRLNR